VGYYSNPTASKNAPKCALCSRQQRCVRTVGALCHRKESHEAAVFLNINKYNAAACRLYSMLNSASWSEMYVVCCGNAVGFPERRGRVVGAPRARCNDAG